MFASPEAIAAAHPGTMPPAYFWPALACLILFPPTGLVAVINSLLVTRRYQGGDRLGSARASYLARVWCAITVAAVAAVFVVSLFTKLPT